MIKLSSFDQLINRIEWKNTSDKELNREIAVVYESDIDKNIILNHKELNNKYPDYSLLEWLNFLSHPQINIQLTKIGATFDDVSGRKLKHRIENLMAKLDSAAGIEPEEAKTLTNFLSYYKSFADNKIKEMNRILNTEGENHTYIYVNKDDPDNSFDVIASSGSELGDPDSKSGNVIEVFRQQDNIFLGFLFLTQGKIPTISQTKATIFPSDKFKSNLEKFKRTFTIHSLKTHKVSIPLKMLKEGMELYVI